MLWAPSLTQTLSGQDLGSLLVSSLLKSVAVQGVHSVVAKLAHCVADQSVHCLVARVAVAQVILVAQVAQVARCVVLHYLVVRVVAVQLIQEDAVALVLHAHLPKAVEARDKHLAADGTDATALWDQAKAVEAPWDQPMVVEDLWDQPMVVVHEDANLVVVALDATARTLAPHRH